MDTFNYKEGEEMAIGNVSPIKHIPFRIKSEYADKAHLPLPGREERQKLLERIDGVSKRGRWLSYEEFKNRGL